MMENLERIERYLDQQLSAAEQQVFEQELTQDTGLQQQVKEVRAARAAIDILYTDSIRQRLQGYETAYVKKQALRRGYSPWAIAAILLPLALLASAWYGLQQHYHAAGWITMDAIVSDYQAPQNGRGNPDNQTRLQQANYAFQTQSYETAISLCQPISPADTLNYYQALTLQGLSYLGLKAPEKTVEVLEQLNQHLESQPTVHSYAPPTHWYLAVSYLQTGQWQQARIHLDWLMKKNINEYKQEEAAEWLQRMDSFWFSWFN